MELEVANRLFFSLDAPTGSFDCGDVGWGNALSTELDRSADFAQSTIWLASILIC